MGIARYDSTVRHYLVINLSGERFGLPLNLVQRVVHAAAVTHLPKAPEIVRGLINYKGRIIPVINMSRRFNLDEHELIPSQNFVIIYTPRRSFALVADSAEGVFAQPMENVIPPEGIIAGMDFLEGVIKLENGMMLIPDLDHLLTSDEEDVLNTLVQKKQKKTISTSSKKPRQKRKDEH